MPPGAAASTVASARTSPPRRRPAGWRHQDDAAAAATPGAGSDAELDAARKEAQAARDAFDALPEPEKVRILTFLKRLKAPESPAEDLLQ